MLDLTIALDRNVIDGAPAARFVADLRRLIGHAEPLRTDDDEQGQGSCGPG